MIGRTLGNYRVVEQIGMGGMATVYKAFDPDTDRYVALKVLPEHYSKDPNFQERFRREAKAIARLEHIHILPVHAYGEQEGTSYLVMRLMETGTLSDRIKRGAIPLDEASRLLSQIASALDYAHSQGIIHRDIKPSNILLDRNNNAFLTDFGIAKMVESPTIDLTGTGIVGTPQYMSPEQCRGQKNLTPASDIYSLGVVVYEMVTGSAPFQAETPLAVIHMQLNEPLPPPRSLRPDLHEQIESVILKALAKAPESRFPSCTAMANAFAQAVAMGLPKDVEVDRMTITPSTEPTRDVIDRTEVLPKKRRLSPWIYAAVGAVVLVIVAAAAILATNSSAPPPTQTIVAAIASNSPPPTEAPETTPTLDTRGAAVATNDAENAINAERTAIFLEGLTATATLWTPTPEITFDEIVTQGDEYVERGNYEAAAASYNQALQLDPDNADLYIRLGGVYITMDNPEEGLQAFTRAVELNPDSAQAYAQLGHTYFYQGDYEQAISNFDRALELDSSDSAAFENRANSHYFLAQYEQAIADYDRALELSPGSTSALINRGDANSALGNSDEAIADYSRVIELQPDYPYAYLGLGRVYDGLGSYDDALSNYQRYLELVGEENDPEIAQRVQELETLSQVESLIVEGDGYVEQGDYEAAIASYTQAIELDPNAIWAYNNRASAYNYGLQDYEAAIADYSQAIELDPDWNPDVYLERGEAYLQSGDYEAAIADFQYAIDRNLGTVQNAHYDLGDAHAAVGDLDAAIEDFSRAIELDSSYVEAYIRRGDVYTELGDYETAIADFTAAMNINPDLAWPYNNRAYAFSALGDLENAIEDFNRVIELDPTYNTNIYLERGDAYLNASDYEAAIADYTQALETNPDAGWGYTNRGEAYLQLGDYDSAMADAARAIELDSSNASAYHLRARIFMAMGDYEQAVPDLEAAIGLNPDFVIYVYHDLGDAYLGLGDCERAINSFTSAVDLDANYAPGYVRRADVYQYCLSDYEQAIPDYTRAIELDSTFAHAYINRGRAYIALGELDSAIADFTRTIELQPDFLADAYYERGLAYDAQGNTAAALADFRAYLDLTADDADPGVIQRVSELEAPPGSLVGIVGGLGSVVRTAPTSTAEQLGALDAGQQIAITGISPGGTYYRVDYNGQVGWVSKVFIAEVQGDLSSVPVIEVIPAPETLTATVGGLGSVVRTAPTSTAEQLGALDAGQQIAITGISPGGTYYRVDYNGQVGWVSKVFIAEVQGDLSSVPVIGGTTYVEGTDLFYDDFEDGNADGWELEPGADVVVNVPNNHVLRVIAPEGDNYVHTWVGDYRLGKFTPSNSKFAW